MPETSLKELNESIELLSGYHDRLQKEVITMAKKLQMPTKKIDSTIESHAELIELKQTINKLVNYRDNQIKKKAYN